MKHLLAKSALLLGFVAFVACSGPSIEVPTPPKVYDAATFFDTTSIRGGSFSHDESKLLMSSDESGVFNVYSQALDGADRVQLTTSTTNATFHIGYFPNDDRFLYRADQGGNELNHIYVHELDGTSVDVTPGESHVARFAGWNKSKTAFFVQTNERDPSNFDLYRYAVDGYERELLFKNEAGYFLSSVNDQESLLAAFKLNGNKDSDVFLIDLATGEPTEISPESDGVKTSFAGFTPDQQGALYDTDGEGEFLQVWRYDLATGDRAIFAQDDWDIVNVNFSEHGRYQVIQTNADASSKLRVTDTTAGQDVVLPDLGGGDITGVGFSPSETKMLLVINGDRSPTNLFVLDLAAPDAEPQQLTRSLTDAISTDDLVDGEVVRYASYDGLEIPGILYRPKTATADDPAPAMLMMHGGPGGQSRRGYNPVVQHLVNHGYAVFAVNNRGSSGYGKTFFHLDDQKHGEADLDDCVAARAYLETLDWVDDTKIGIMGGSYGGYLVAAALAFRPEVFDVGLDIFGVTNWLRTLQNMPAWWGPQREALYEELGNPETDAERLRRISPVFHADKITKPLFVVQGKNDPRVLQVESDEIVAAVRANGVPVEYLVFDDEGHGFRNKDNRIEAQNAYLGFLDRYLRGHGEPAATTGD